jgi:dihydrodipicolinate reductase
MKKIVIIGNGKLADSILSNLCKYTVIKSEKYSSTGIFDKDTVFVHIGSGREFEESLNIAIKCKSSYIQAATGKEYSLEPPENITIKFLHAPNLDTNIIKLIHWLKIGRNLFQNEEISLKESHQSEKKSKPGTAIKFAEYLGINENDIVSIRDKSNQKELKIKTLDHHAYHEINIGDCNSSIKIETKIEGAISYSKGLAKIVECIDKLEIGKHEIEELVSLQLL